MPTNDGEVKDAGTLKPCDSEIGMWAVRFCRTHLQIEESCKINSLQAQLEEMRSERDANKQQSNNWAE